MAPAQRHPARTRTGGTGTPWRAAFGVAAWLMATGAQAQSSACDQLKERLASRLQFPPGTYTLEAVPSDTPLPPGGKYIGTCEGSAKKILFRRGQAAPVAVAPAASAARVAPDAPKPAEVVRPVAVEAPAPRPAPVPPPPPPPPPAPEPVARVTPPPVPVPEPPPPSREPAPLAQAEPDAAPAVAADDGDGPGWVAWAGEHWPWLAAVLLVPLLFGGWNWFSYRRAYDEAGLPRGPRL